MKNFRQNFKTIHKQKSTWFGICIILIGIVFAINDDPTIATLFIVPGISAVLYPGKSNDCGDVHE